MYQERGDRFRGKTGDYSRNRPGYPQEIITILQRENAVNSHSTIADIGSGTGKLAELFLKNGLRVVCVEPNPEMRTQASVDLMGYHDFSIMDGTAEDTGIDRNSVDLVVAGQAFHWFSPAESAGEFLRILKPGGMAALIWNDRVLGRDDFNAEYEHICRVFSNGYHQPGSLALDRSIIDRFFEGNVKVFTLENAQKLDLEGIMGRYFSASYALGPEDSRYAELLMEFCDAFSRHSVDGFATIRYQSRVFLGTPYGGH